MKRKVQVWVVNPSERQVLLLKTTEERGAFWQPVTGGVEEGESDQEAAQRELFEETGIDNDFPVEDLGYEFDFKTRYGNFATEHVFFVSLDRQMTVKLDSKEHQDFRWFSIEEVHEDVLKFHSVFVSFEKMCSQVF